MDRASDIISTLAIFFGLLTLIVPMMFVLKRVSDKLTAPLVFIEPDGDTEIQQENSYEATITVERFFQE